jgi:hypothetical protein
MKEHGWVVTHETSLWRSKVFSKALCNVLNLGKWRLIMESSTLNDTIYPPLTCLLLKQKLKKKY